MRRLFDRLTIKVCRVRRATDACKSVFAHLLLLLLEVVVILVERAVLATSFLPVASATGQTIYAHISRSWLPDPTLPWDRKFQGGRSFPLWWSIYPRLAPLIGSAGREGI